MGRRGEDAAGSAAGVPIAGGSDAAEISPDDALEGPTADDVRAAGLVLGRGAMPCVNGRPEGRAVPAATDDGGISACRGIDTLGPLEMIRTGMDPLVWRFRKKPFEWPAE